MRSCDGFTGTGLAYPNTGSPASAPIAGRMIVPNGSTCDTGFSVIRPARRAVSSPNHRATTPWLTSWRITAVDEADEEDDGRLEVVAHGGGTWTSRRSGRRDAAWSMQKPRRGHRFEASLANPPAAGLARAVGAGSNFAIASSISRERLDELPGDGIRLAAFGGDLAGIGEVLVEVEIRPATVTEASDLFEAPGAFALELVT